MAYWLMKSEPGAWSWDQQRKSGAKGEAWSGVRNFQAKLNLMKMKKGDRAFFYHSNVGQGDRRHCRDHSRALSRPDGQEGRAVGGGRRQSRSSRRPKPVTLHAIKAEPKLKDMVLVKNSRLSVQPVTGDEWKIVCKMGGL